VTFTLSFQIDDSELVAQVAAIVDLLGDSNGTYASGDNLTEALRRFLPGLLMQAQTDAFEPRHVDLVIALLKNYLVDFEQYRRSYTEETSA